MKNTTIKTLLVAITVSLLFAACSKISDLGDLEIDSNGEYAIPIGHASFSFEDVIGDFDGNTSLTIENDGLIRLNYKGDVLETSADNIFQQLEIIAPVFVTDTVVKPPFDIPNSIFITYVDMKAGTLSLNFKSNHDEPLEVKIVVDEITKNGVSFERNYSVEPNANQFDIRSLIGWRWNANGNNLTIRYEAYKADGTRVFLDDFIILLSGLKYSYAEGYLGNQLYEVGRDTIFIDFFNNWISGNIFFEEPALRLTAFNSFGFPLDAKLNSIDILTIDNNVLPLQSQFITDGIEVNYPSFNQIGETITTVFDFNNSNSNIQQLLSAKPIAIDYNLDGESNPEIDTTILGFMTDTSFFKVQMEAELPIYGAAMDFEVQDTIELDLREYEDSAASAEFKIISKNNLPVSVNLQLYFSDGNTVFDSLFVPAQNILESAIVDANGYVTSASEKTTFAPIDETRFKHLTQATKMIFKTTFNTYNNGNTPVRVLAGQNVDLRVGMKVQR